jgi:hypothetical protein
VSGSEYKSELFFGFGSSQNIRILSDLDHQQRKKGSQLINYRYSYQSKKKTIFQANKTGIRENPIKQPGTDTRIEVKLSSKQQNWNS